jgi:hypothetical protein
MFTSIAFLSSAIRRMPHERGLLKNSGNNEIISNFMTQKTQNQYTDYTEILHGAEFAEPAYSGHR